MQNGQSEPCVRADPATVPSFPNRWTSSAARPEQRNLKRAKKLRAVSGTCPC